MHPLEAMSKGSSAMAKLRPHVEEIMRRDDVGWEQALGRVSHDPSLYGLVQTYKEELRAG